MMRLGVNIDHVATLRQVRGNTPYPDPVQAALIAQDAGADGITLHLREDRRHIQDRDVAMLKSVLQVPMNLEMAATTEMIQFALAIKPEYCCLVPERREEVTTEGGLDVVGHEEALKKTCHTLQEQGIQVSLFIDADRHQIDAAHRTGASTIEIHTGEYALAQGLQQAKALSDIIEAAQHAHQQGLIVNAGHGLHYHNTHAIAQIPVLHELNIGHSIIARAVFYGLHEAVSTMKSIIRNAGQKS